MGKCLNMTCTLKNYFAGIYWKQARCGGSAERHNTKISSHITYALDWKIRPINISYKIIFKIKKKNEIYIWNMCKTKIRLNVTWMAQIINSKNSEKGQEAVNQNNSWRSQKASIFKDHSSADGACCGVATPYWLRKTHHQPFFKVVLSSWSDFLHGSWVLHQQVFWWMRQKLHGLSWLESYIMALWLHSLVVETIINTPRF